MAHACQIEFVGILKGTKKLEAAQKFVDFMLSQPFRKLCLANVCLPVIPNAVLPEATKYAAVLTCCRRFCRHPPTVAGCRHDRNRITLN
jgi:ABC-type thiamine transport system substrate-binding protein